MTTAAQLSENSHQGFEGIKAAVCLASMDAKSNSASRMPVCLWQEGIGSRSSGKERDAETGLDYFGARYYSGAQGRFITPDWSAKPQAVPYARFEDPQTLNLYAYVRNNPLSRIDPDGHLDNEFHKKKDITFKYIKNLKGNDGNYYSVSWKAEKGYVFADNGKTKVTAFRATGDIQVTVKNDKGKVVSTGGSELLGGSGWNNTADCHGTTFADGKLWINNDQVKKILKGDNYAETSSPKTNSVGIYSDDTGIVHSVRVDSTNPVSGQVDTVTSKGGITPLEHVAPGPGPGTGWGDPATLKYYDKKEE